MRSVVRATALLAALVPVALPAAARPLPEPEQAVCGSALPGDRSLVGLAPGVDADVLRRSGLRVLGTIDEIDVAVVAGRVPHRLRGVEWVEPDVEVRVTETPADPEFVRQWGLREINASSAWNVEVGASRPVLLAVLDTGVDLEHPDLAGKVLDGPNTTGGTTSQDDHVHGTHVAGIAAAATNNRRGIAGVSWGATILAVKVLDADGTGSSCGVLRGMVEAVRAGANVLNLSLGRVGACSASYQRAVDFATRHDALVVAAAGNGGDGFNHPLTPANCDGVLAVGAIGPDGRHASFSNHGDYVDVAAPGVDIVSTVFDRNGRRGYAPLSGTSMATPFVAGLAALLAAAHPDWTPVQLAERIVTTARDRGPRGRDPRYGAGVVDAAAALR